METRKCTVCGEEKPFTQDYFKSDSKGLNGLGAQCKVCFNQKQQEYRARRRGEEPPAREGCTPRTARAHPSAAGALREEPRVKGPRYTPPTWKRTGVIIRDEYAERIKDEAWKRREDVTECLDRILSWYFGEK